MIKITHGNLLKAKVEALVNTVNTEGAMGKGIAAQFKRAYPPMFDKYSSDCAAGLVEIGKMHVVDLGGLVGGPRWIINFPTKKHWRAKSKIGDIRAGLADLVSTVRRLDIKSIAIPPLGCGYGGLSWQDVRPLIEEAMSQLPETEILIFPPEGAPAAVDMPTRTERPHLTVGRAALISLMARYRLGLLDPLIRLLEVHKLMYFMQASGEPLRLSYSKQQYGPYAANLRHVLTRLEGHWISGYGDGQDQPLKELTLFAGAEAEAAQLLAEYPDVTERIDRVAKLIEGVEDPDGMELLSTVHWVMSEDADALASADEAVVSVHRWSERKAKLLRPDHIRKAWLRLKELGWAATNQNDLIATL